MGPGGAFRWARFVATGPLIRRGLIVSGLTLVERLLTPAAAWVLFQQGSATKVAVTLTLAVTVTAQHFASRVFAARTEADLTARVTGSILAGDVLRSTVLVGEDAQVELSQGIYSTSQALSQGLPVFVADVVACAVLAIVMGVVEPARIVIVALGLTFAAGAVLGWSRSHLQKAVMRAWDLQCRAFDVLVDALGGRLEIVASGGRSLFVAEALRRSRAWGASSARVVAWTVLSGRLMVLSIVGVVCVAFGVDPHLRASLPVTFAELALLASVTPPFAGAAHGLLTALQAERWLRVVGQIVRDVRPPSTGKGLVGQSPATVAFEGISFRYGGTEGDTDVLADVSFTCNRGQLLALSGVNGSGKSTCLRLLLGLATPRAGVIRVDGVDLEGLDAEAWRSQVAFLPQRPYLPPRSSVKAAIQLLAPTATDERMARALDRVGLTEALRRVGSAPLDVSVDILSVGQRQRVALARMMCRDASVFLLDEPEANLDRAGIELVAEIVRELAKDHMVMVAVHTPELLRVASEVVELDGGRVVKK